MEDFRRQVVEVKEYVVPVLAYSSSFSMIVMIYVRQLDNDILQEVHDELMVESYLLYR